MFNVKKTKLSHKYGRWNAGKKVILCDLQHWKPAVLHRGSCLTLCAVFCCVCVCVCLCAVKPS